MSTINVSKLHRELEAAGIPIYGVSETGYINFAPETTTEQRDQAAQILASHDPTDYVALEAEANRESLREKYAETVEKYSQALTNWDSLTPAQQKDVLKANTQVLLHLLKFIRSQFEY